MANTYKLLSSTVLTGTQTTITFSSIPAGYTDLVLSVSARTNSGSVADAIRYTLNNDSSAVYTFKVGYGNGTSAVATGETNYTVAGRYFYANVGNGSTANTFGNGELYISCYASQQRKAISENGVNENNATAANLNMGATVWAQNQAVSSIELQSWNGADFVAGSSFYLYGVFNGTGNVSPSVPTIGTAVNGTTGTDVSVVFTATSAAGVDASYTALSSPGSITTTGTASPITVSGLTTGTAYTFQVRANNPGGSSAYSAASNSVTPEIPAAYDSIQTITTSGSTSITFTSIPQTYKDLQLRILCKTTTAGSADTENLFIQFNGVTTGTAYSYYNVRASGAGTVGASSIANTNTIQIGYGVNSGTTTTGYFAPNIINIGDYASTVKNKSVTGMGGVEINISGSSSLVYALQTGSWSSTAAITSITLSSASNFASGVQFALYGIKG